MAKKKSDTGFLKEVATATGQLAGTVLAHRSKAGNEGEPSHDDVRFEKSDVSHRGLLIGGACLISGMWLTVALLFFYFNYLKDYRARVSPPPLPYVARGNPLPPEPRLQGSPVQDLKTYRAGQQWELTHYYWLDKDKGQVAIPIEQAIQMLARRGIPPQKTPPNLTLTPPQTGTRLTGFEGKVEPEPR